MYLGAHLLHDLYGDTLHLLAWLVQVGLHVIDVEFERVGPGLLYLRGVLGPSADGAAVEAGDDGDAYRLLGLANVLEIAFRSARVHGVPSGARLLRERAVTGAGARRRRLRGRRALRDRLLVLPSLAADVSQLLLEQRVEH